MRFLWWESKREVGWNSFCNKKIKALSALCKLTEHAIRSTRKSFVDSKKRRTDPMDDRPSVPRSRVRPYLPRDVVDGKVEVRAQHLQGEAL